MDKITLVVVDFQYDFCLLGGSLYVPGSDKALWNIETAMTDPRISQVVFTVDWHPANHCSFKENGGEWNAHCIQYSKGAAIHDLLLQTCITNKIPYDVLRKGASEHVEEYGVKVTHNSFGLSLDSLTGFVSVDSKTQYVICGLAGDYCVLECLRNLKELNPMVYLPGIASIDGGAALDKYVKENNVTLWDQCLVY